MNSIDGFEIGDVAELNLNGAEHGDLFAGVTATPTSGYEDQTYTVAQALAPEPPLPELVEGVMEEAGVNMFVGLPAALKSLLGMDLGICIATGAPWLPDAPGRGNHPGFPTRQMGVLWCDADSGLRRLKKRLAALCRSRNITDAPFYYMSHAVPPIAAASRHGLQGLDGVVRSLECGLVVFDTYLSMAGVKDENSSENQAAMTAFHRLADATGATVILIHHPTKLGNEDDLKSVRGHGSIAGGLDYVFSITRKDKGDVVVVSSLKDRDAPVTRFAALWTFEPSQDNPRDMHSARFWRANVDEASKAVIWSRIQQALADGPLNQTEVVKAVRMRKADVLDVLGTKVLARELKAEGLKPIRYELPS
jgi:hypothetical protein